MLRNDRFLAVRMLLTIVLSLLLADFAQAQLWRQFAHPDKPHVTHADGGPNVRITVPELFNDPNAVVRVPVLVVLMEYTDVTHETVHNVQFFSDLFFGQGRANGRPSVAETYRENSNGQLLLVPATAGDNYGAKDGIVGWVTTPYTFAHWDADIRAKRAEAIRLADPFFNYSLYDNDGPDGIPNSGDDNGTITSDELVIVVINADDTCCDQHGHANLPGCSGCAGGNCRRTNPSQVDVEGGQFRVYQLVAALVEQASHAVFAHEIGHQLLGLEDLYPVNCTGKQQVADGYICNNDPSKWYPFRPGWYTLMDVDGPGIISHFDPWAKIHLGFVKPLVVTQDGTYRLYDAETERNLPTQNAQPEAIIIYDPLRPDPYKEYFILENRERNTSVMDRGLALWLINENGPDWPLGLILRRVIRLIRRDGGADNLGQVHDLQALWDGVNSTDGYDLNATSIPIDTSWTDGSSSYIEVYDISQAGPSMTFKVTMPPIFVDQSQTGTENGSQANPFDTVYEGVSAIPTPPRTIKIAGGSYPDSIVINTPCTLKGWRNGNAVIGR